MTLAHPTEDRVENSVRRLESDLKRLDNQIDSLRVVYLHAPPALRSPILHHELLALVGKRARLDIEIARAKEPKA